MTLRKMFLVSSEQYGAGTLPLREHDVFRSKKTKPSKRKIVEASTFDKWVTFRDKMREDDVKKEMQLQKIAQYLRKVLPNVASRKTFLTHALAQTDFDPIESFIDTPNSATTKRDVLSEPMPGPSYETPKRSVFESEEEYDDDDDEVYSEQGTDAFVTRVFGRVASPYLSEHAKKVKRNLDRVYGLRKKGNVFMIGDSDVLVDTNSNLTIKGRKFEGTEGLWQLLALKNVDLDNVSKEDLSTYKSILQLTNGHLEGYAPGGSINVTGGIKFGTVIAKLFPQSAARAGALLRRKWQKY